MKAEFHDYLTEIEMSTPLIQRVEHFHDLYTNLLVTEPTHIFVTDLISEDDLRSYDSLWFFNDSQALEAHRFVDDEAFDLGGVSEVTLWRIDQEAFVANEATSESRLKVTFSSRDGISGDLRATGNNCDYLWRLVRDWFVPRSAGATVST